MVAKRQDLCRSISNATSSSRVDRVSPQGRELHGVHGDVGSGNEPLEGSVATRSTRSIDDQSIALVDVVMHNHRRFVLGTNSFFQSETLSPTRAAVAHDRPLPQNVAQRGREPQQPLPSGVVLPSPQEQENVLGTNHHHQEVAQGTTTREVLQEGETDVLRTSRPVPSSIFRSTARRVSPLLLSGLGPPNNHDAIDDLFPLPLVVPQQQQRWHVRSLQERRSLLLGIINSALEIAGDNDWDDSSSSASTGGNIPHRNSEPFLLIPAGGGPLLASSPSHEDEAEEETKSSCHPTDSSFCSGPNPRQ